TIEATSRGKSRQSSRPDGWCLFLIGCNGEGALALGPEGPLVEEFWDNVRRYAIYALTVST
ncbi:hypothetical protein Csa_006654, partial [Cucumis sativus]